MHASLTAFLPTYINLESGNLWLAGMALTLFEGAGVAGVLTAGSMSDLFGRRKTLLVSLIGAPVCLFIFTFTGGWFRIAALLVTGFTLLSTTPVMLALVQEHARHSSGGSQRVVYDDLVYLPIGGGCRGRVHCRPHRAADHLFYQRRHGVDWYSVYF